MEKFMLQVGAGAAFTWLLLLPATGSAQPVTFGVEVTEDALQQSGGGLKAGGKIINDLDFSAAWQGGNGWRAAGDILVDSGGGFSSTYVGDMQGVSNNDGNSGVRLFEAYINKASGPVNLSLGLIDFTSHFDVQFPDDSFISSPRQTGPELAQVGISSSPVSALGVVGEWQVSKTWTLRSAIYDAVPGDPANPKAFVSVNLSADEGALGIIEAERDFDRGSVKVGYWRETSVRDRLNGNGAERPAGGYAEANALLAGNADRGLTGFVRLGYADGRVLPVQRSAALALIYKGAFSSRGQDSVGVSVSDACFGQDYRNTQGGLTACERNYEGFYQLKFKNDLVVQPDIQVVVHPSGRKDLHAAAIVGARLIKSFGG